MTSEIYLEVRSQLNIVENILSTCSRHRVMSDDDLLNSVQSVKHNINIVYVKYSLAVGYRSILV